MKTKKRADRTQRRVDERDARKLARARQELARLEPGGAPDRPIEVVASPIVEMRAASLPCPLCGGALRVDDQQAKRVEGRSLRVVAVTCLRCGIARSLWFRIGTPLAN